MEDVRLNHALFSLSRGLKPASSLTQAQLTKQELAEVCQRRTADEIEGDHERVKGVGFKR